MSPLFFLFALSTIFSGAAGWAFWQWRSGRTDERPMWLKVFHICLMIAGVCVLAWLLDLTAMWYHVKS